VVEPKPDLGCVSTNRTGTGDVKETVGRELGCGRIERTGTRL